MLSTCYACKHFVTQWANSLTSSPTIASNLCILLANHSDANHYTNNKAQKYVHFGVVKGISEYFGVVRSKTTMYLIARYKYS